MLVSSLFAASSLLHEGQRALTTERVVNMFPEIVPARQQVTLRSVPGLVDQYQAGPGQVRAMVATSTALYTVAGGEFASWDGTTRTLIGIVADGPTTMAVNTSGEVAIAADGTYYLWDGTTFSQPTGGAFSRVGSVDFIDGFFVRSAEDGSAFDITGINDGDALDALDFASAEYKPDKLIRTIVNGGLVWNFGERTVEPWQNIGDADFPFSRLSSSVLEKGLRSSGEVARLDNTVFWVSQEPRVYRITDFAPQKVSTTSVDVSLGTEALCFAYQYQGHDFLVIRLPDKPARVFDVQTQSWHERATGVDLGAWEVTTATPFKGVWYAGTDDGYVSLFSGYQDRGEEMRREVISKNISNGGNRFRVFEIDARVEAGTGGNVMLSHSSDGGRTFSPERQRSVGSVGEYDRRVKLHSQGQHREFALKMACTDNVDFAIYDAGVRLG